MYSLDSLSPSPPPPELHIRLGFDLDTAVSSGVRIKPEISLKTTPVLTETVFLHGELHNLRLHHVLDILRIAGDAFDSLDDVEAQRKLIVLLWLDQSTHVRFCLRSTPRAPSLGCYRFRPATFLPFCG